MVEVFVIDREEVEGGAFGEGFFVGDLEPLEGVVTEGRVEGILMWVGEQLGEVAGTDEGAKGKPAVVREHGEGGGLGCLGVTGWQHHGDDGVFLEPRGYRGRRKGARVD